MRLAATAVILAGLVLQGAAQEPIPKPEAPPARTPMRDTERQIVVEGCIQGNRLRIDLTNQVNRLIVDIIDVTEFVLEGPKETLRLVASSHDNHEDEITGIVVIPATRHDSPEVVTKDLGKRTRVTAGATSVITEPIEAPRSAKPVRLKFLSLKHLSDKCSVPAKVR